MPARLPDGTLSRLSVSQTLTPREPGPTWGPEVKQLPEGEEGAR
jgi:hypothetical protein